MKRRKGSFGIIVIIAVVITILLIIFITPFLLYGRWRSGLLDKATGGGNGCAIIPPPYNKIFSDAGRRFSVQPAVIGAIFVGEHRSIKDSDYKSWPDAEGPWATSQAGASGPFQFMPGTWESHKQDGNGDGKTDIQNLSDAAFAASHLLKGKVGDNSTDEGAIREAASMYNSGCPWDKPCSGGSKRGQDIPETYTFVEELVLPSFRSFYCNLGGLTSGIGYNNVPLFKQCDERWGTKSYGSSTICKSGCGPTSAAMVLKYYGFAVDPITISKFSAENECYVPGVGTNGSCLIPKLAKEYGLKYESLDNNWDKALKHLENEHPLIVSGKGPKPFTANGHFIVLTGYNREKGEVNVNNTTKKGDGPFPLTLIKQHTKRVHYIGRE